MTDGESHQDGAPANGAAPADALVVSDAVADRIGELFSASEDAARAIRAKASSDARTLIQTATRQAAGQARVAVATIASESVPMLEARIAQLRELVEAVRSDVEQLEGDLGRLASGTSPAGLPRAMSAAPQPARTPAERQALLIAFNMAGNGASREEAARYLTDHLKMEDPETLLDAVYGAVAPESDGAGHNGNLAGLPEPGEPA